MFYEAVTHIAGSTENPAGDDGTDKIFGSVAAMSTHKIVTPGKPGTYKFSDPITMFTKTGSLSGTTSATLILNEGGTITLTDGKLSVANGSGGQKGHSLVGTYTGSGSYLTGRHVFHYQGVYK